MTTARLLYSIIDAAEQLSIGRAKVEDLVRTGEIESIKLGRRRLIPAEALTDYVERLRAAS